MKRVGIALSLLLLVAGTARAQVGINVGSAVATRYIWRGFDLSGAPGKTVPAFQPTATFAFNDFTVNWWGSFNMAERDNGSDQLDEFDLTVGTSKSPVEGFTMNFGMIYYTFPQLQAGGNRSLEAYMGFSTNKVSFSPAVTFYYDIDLANGLYTLVSASQPLLTDPRFPLNFNFSLGFGHSYYIETHDNFVVHDVNLGLSTSWSNKYVTFSPSVVWTGIPSEKIQAFSGHDDSYKLWGLFSLSFAF